MRPAIALLLLGAGALAFGWGVHDAVQVFVGMGGCSTDGPKYCPPGVGLSIVLTIAGAFAMFASSWVHGSGRIHALTFGLFGTTIGIATMWSQFGPSAQPDGPSILAAGIGLLALIVGFGGLRAANATTAPVFQVSDGSGGSYWSFDSDGGSGDSGCSSGCGGGCGGGD